MFSSKSPERVGVGEHQAGDVVGRLLAQVVDVDPAALVGRDLDHLVAGHRHGRRVGPVGRVGGQHLAALLAAVGVVGAGEQQAGQLAVRAGRRLQADVGKAADLRQRPLQLPHQLQCPLGALGVLGRVQPRVAGQRRDPLVEARVVLHRAGAERIEAACRGRSCAARCGCSGARSRARRPRAAAGGSERSRCSGTSSTSGRSGTPASGSVRGAAPRLGASRRSSSPCRAASGRLDRARRATRASRRHPRRARGLRRFATASRRAPPRAGRSAPGSGAR